MVGGKMSASMLPPQNLEAEQSILGGLLLEASAFDQVADLITEEDFYRPAHQTIYRAVKELQAKSERPDLLTVSNLLDARRELEAVGGATYLAALLEKTFSAAN